MRTLARPLVFLGWYFALLTPNAVMGMPGQTAAPRLIRISAGVLGGILEHGANPVYPEQAIRGGIQGEVVLILENDETGRVVRSFAVESDPLLVAASIEALKEFQFRPYLLNNEPISVESQIEFRFAIKGKKEKAQGTSGYTFDVPYRPEFRTGAVTKDGILILSPRQISGPDPVMLPELAGKSGSVYLTVTIGIDGKVEDVRVMGGDEALIAPVVAAVEQAVFEPKLVAGQPTRSKIEESYHFGTQRK